MSTKFQVVSPTHSQNTSPNTSPHISPIPPISSHLNGSSSSKKRQKKINQNYISEGLTQSIIYPSSPHPSVCQCDRYHVSDIFTSYLKVANNVSFIATNLFGFVTTFFWFKSYRNGAIKQASHFSNDLSFNILNSGKALGAAVSIQTMAITLFITNIFTHWKNSTPPPPHLIERV